MSNLSEVTLPAICPGFRLVVYLKEGNVLAFGMMKLIVITVSSPFYGNMKETVFYVLSYWVSLIVSIITLIW